MDFLNALILLLNYIFIPALTYGSQLALGAIFVTLIYGILRFANFATGDMNSIYLVFSIAWDFFRSFAYSLISNSIWNFFYDPLYAKYR